MAFAQNSIVTNWSSVHISDDILFPVVPLPTPPAMAVTEGGKDEDQTGDSGMGTGSESAQYLMRDFLPGIVHLIIHNPTISFYFDTCIHSSSSQVTGQLLCMSIYITVPRRQGIYTPLKRNEVRRNLYSSRITRTSKYMYTMIALALASIALYISNISKCGSKSSRLAITVAPLAVCNG